MKSPCKDCPDRYVGCHERCSKYLAYKAEREAERQARYRDYIADGNSPTKNTALKIVGSLKQRCRYGK